MVFKYAVDMHSNCHRLHRVAEQVAYHAHTADMGQFHKHSDIGTMLPERRMGRMPRALPTEDTAPRFDLYP